MRSRTSWQQLINFFGGVALLLGVSSCGFSKMDSLSALQDGTESTTLQENNSFTANSEVGQNDPDASEPAGEPRVDPDDQQGDPDDQQGDPDDQQGDAGDPLADEAAPDASNSDESDSSESLVEDGGSGESGGLRQSRLFRSVNLVTEADRLNDAAFISAQQAVEFTAVNPDLSSSFSTLYGAYSGRIFGNSFGCQHEVILGTSTSAPCIRPVAHRAIYQSVSPQLNVVAYTKPKQGVDGTELVLESVADSTTTSKVIYRAGLDEDMVPRHILAVSKGNSHILSITLMSRRMFSTQGKIVVISVSNADLSAQLLGEYQTSSSAAGRKAFLDQQDRATFVFNNLDGDDPKVFVLIAGQSIVYREIIGAIDATTSEGQIYALTETQSGYAISRLDGNNLTELTQLNATDLLSLSTIDGLNFAAFGNGRYYTWHRANNTLREFSGLIRILWGDRMAIYRRNNSYFMVSGPTFEEVSLCQGGCNVRQTENWFYYQSSNPTRHHLVARDGRSVELRPTNPFDVPSFLAVAFSHNHIFVTSLDKSYLFKADGTPEQEWDANLEGSIILERENLLYAQKVTLLQNGDHQRSFRALTQTGWTPEFELKSPKPHVQLRGALAFGNRLVTVKNSTESQAAHIIALPSSSAESTSTLLEWDRSSVNLSNFHAGDSLVSLKASGDTYEFLRLRPESASYLSMGTVTRTEPSSIGAESAISIFNRFAFPGLGPSGAHEFYLDLNQNQVKRLKTTLDISGTAPLRYLGHTDSRIFFLGDPFNTPSNPDIVYALNANGQKQNVTISGIDWSLEKQNICAGIGPGWCLLNRTQGLSSEGWMLNLNTQTAQMVLPANGEFSLQTYSNWVVSPNSMYAPLEGQNGLILVHIQAQPYALTRLTANPAKEILFLGRKSFSQTQRPIYFAISDNSSLSKRIYCTDGTIAGTREIYSSSAALSNIFVVGHHLLAQRSGVRGGLELTTCSGTSNRRFIPLANASLHGRFLGHVAEWRGQEILLLQSQSPTSENYLWLFDPTNATPEFKILRKLATPSNALETLEDVVIVNDKAHLSLVEINGSYRRIVVPLAP
jgi:hypothetical protein